MTREKAIKIIKEFIKGTCLHLVDQEALETLIPELKESEDERIRKALIFAVRDWDYVDGIESKKVLAWLEKQKEPLPIPNKFSGLKSLMLQYLQSAANRKDDSEIESDTDLWGRKILDYVWKYSDEQKEHEIEVKDYRLRDTCEYIDKFIKKFRIPKDVDELSACVNYVIEHKSIDEKEQKKSLSEKFRPDFPTVADFIERVDDMEKDRSVEILEDYLKWAVSSEEECPYTWNELANAIQLGINAMKEHKHAKWSEEDSAKIGTLSSIIFDYAFYKDALDENHDLKGEYAELDTWLRELPERFNLQPKQGWSEKDKNIIEGMIVDYKGEIEHLSDSIIDEQAKPIYQERIDFLERLKSYCPQSYNKDAQKVINDSIYLIEHYASHGHDKEHRENIINRLKSLLPQPHTVSIKDSIKFGNLEYERGVKDGIQSEKSRQWKPSEEQIKEYGYWYRNFIESGVASPTSKAVTVLGELLEQLEKL